MQNDKWIINLFAGSACLATTSRIKEDTAESSTSPVKPVQM